MDNLLCDELLQEIFTRITNSSSSSSCLSVCLVSKRWLHLYRTSKTSLSLRLNLENSTIQSLSPFLANYPFLSSISLILSSDPTKSTPPFNDHLLFIVSNLCSNLKHLRFLTGPVSTNSLISFSNSCTLLTSLTLFLARPLYLNWVAYFSHLKDLSIRVISVDGSDQVRFGSSGLCLDQEFDAELGLGSLNLSGIRRGDLGFGWLWRNTKNLKKLQLKSCEGVGDGGSFVSFTTCLKGIQEMELRTCRSIIHGILLRMAENCESLNSLLIYDGGSREGLLHFITNCRCNLQILDLRLPLDLNNDHLLAIGMNFRNLSILRLQSCCLVTGEGLKGVGIGMNSSNLEELALINCDVVERESGLLATLGQNLRRLRKLDLSHNELLVDKEIISMLVSCNGLIELKLRGCRKVSSSAMVSMLKNCKNLEFVDIMNCCGIEVDVIEMFLLNSLRLRCIQVEECKLSDAAKKWAEHKFIRLVA
ncbi:uncharacterized protein LOC126675368 [Mercurialis annua]|uniref:uncharacterized protein LOC126675368 n=1 Tax=Mercurialis annua TaxID=3986 RepID=UPI00215F062B|nr:uncharacterized protein LOC126675368 [Mercurialis annua]